MMSRFSTVLLLSIAAAPVWAASVRQAGLGTAVNESSCAVQKLASSFRTTDRQIFLALRTSAIQAGDELQIDWTGPAGNVEQSTPYSELPGAAELCFITQMPVSGFGAASLPGSWVVRVSVGRREIWSRAFQIEGDMTLSRLSISSVKRSPVGTNEAELELDGTGFESSSIVHVAEYTKGGGWNYIQSLLPGTGTADRLTVRLPALSPGEYLAVVRNPDGSTSKPSRFLVETAGGYRLPIAGGERWVITQGPYGSFSHWNQSLHAYDIAPRGGTWVTAMRAGTVYAHDLRMGQSHARRTFGNYITLEHDGGEFSHYAHLATGTFLVKTGDRVEAGQPLAHVGNSGYTLGEGGGYHVHVHVTKSQPASAQSIPFKFDELAEAPVTRLRGLEVTSHATPVSLARIHPAVQGTQAPAHIAGNAKTLTGSVRVTENWSDALVVKPNAKALEAVLLWDGAGRDLDLHLVSPSGHHYGWYGDRAGYSGQQSNPERYRIEHPEPGQWRVMVAGMSGGPEPVPFRVEAALAMDTPHESRHPVRLRAR